MQTELDRVARRRRARRRGVCRGAGDQPPGEAATRPVPPGFSTAVSLSHTNSPARSPLFPGDPVFTLTTVNTVAEDGYYMQYVREGEHTGTHYSAPCHFREGKLCAEDLDAADFILPAVVIDVRAEVAADANHVVTRADLQDWEAVHGEMPSGAAVLLWTRYDEFWGPDLVKGRAHLLQLRPARRALQPTRLLEGRRSVVDRHGRPGPTRCTGHGHVRSRSIGRCQLLGVVPHAEPAPLHPGEPHEPGSDARRRWVDRDRRAPEPQRLGCAQHDLRPGAVRPVSPPFRAAARGPIGSWP